MVLATIYSTLTRMHLDAAVKIHYCRHKLNYRFNVDCFSVCGWVCSILLF